MSTIVVTGADGFIGSQLCALLTAYGHRVRGTVRTRGTREAPAGIEIHALGSIDQQPAWASVLAGSDCVIHLAGRAHVLAESRGDVVDAFRRTNVDASTTLFKVCRDLDIRRFVYVSSIGVLGVKSGSQPFNAASQPHPTEAYAISKWQAETALASLASTSRTELVIVRPTLVCGAGARGNFQRLVQLVKRGLPLPLASVSGQRHFVGLHNLCDLLRLCSLHPAASGKTYLAADEGAWTVPQLIYAIADSLSLNARLLPCPPSILRFTGRLLGRRLEIERLTESLLVDASLARSELGWRNTFPMPQEIISMARSLSDP